MSTESLPHAVPQQPRLRHEAAFHPTDNGLYEITHPEIDQHYEVNEQGRFLLELMDGRNRRSEIREAYKRRFQSSISRDQLIDLIELWSFRGLLDNNLPLSAEIAAPSSRPSESQASIEPSGPTYSQHPQTETSPITSANATSKVRSKRRRVRLLGALGILFGAMFIPINDRGTGTFRVRPATRLEVSVAEAGFLQNIAVQEGTQVQIGTTLAKIYIPDLAVNLTKKQAEIDESAARLRRLEVGSRPEEIKEQQASVERDVAWRDLAERDLARVNSSLAEEVIQLDNQITQAETELKYAEQAAAHSKSLLDQKAISGEQYMAEQTRADLAKLRSEEVRARKAERQAIGSIVAESELARRAKELADEESKLKLLQAGTRPEDIDAEQARLDRLRVELKYLQEMEQRTVVVSPVEGLVTTPRMNEKNGQYVLRGAVLCTVEELSNLYAEISVREDMEHEVRPGQQVQMRPRSMPYETFESVVERKAPSAVSVPGQTQGTVTVYCKLNEAHAGVLSGMTGYARIYRGYRPLGLILLDRFRRYLRTEFWF